MKLPVLKVAVVGHTNTGKTSLLRTLTRNIHFGEVSDRPATTRHVEGTAILIGNKPLIELYDTPGLEDSIALLEHLNAHRGMQRIDVEVVKTFLSSLPARTRFTQEAKAIRQLLASDVALYVIDARDRVLGKHQDELEILARCARPVVAVLNFTAAPDAKTSVWRDHLARAGLHAVAEFDTVVLTEESEQRLLEKMKSLLDEHRGTLDSLIQVRRNDRDQLIRVSAELVADLVIDVAAFAMMAPISISREAAGELMESMRGRVRDREQQCVKQLLDIHRFGPEDCRAADLPLTEGRWGVDLFNPAALKQFGIRTGSAAAAGALAGLSIDAMLGGLSLGAASGLGALIGALIATGRMHGRRLMNRMMGQSELRCDHATLRLLLLRQCWLIHALLRRGHASLTPIQLESHPGERATPASQGTLSRELEEAALHPGWSLLNEPAKPTEFAGTARRMVRHRLAQLIEEQIRSGAV